MVRYRIRTKKPDGKRYSQVVVSNDQWSDIFEKYQRKSVRGRYVQPIDEKCFKYVGKDGVVLIVTMLSEN